MAHLLREESDEQIHGALRQAEKLLECWENRLTFDHLALAERYLKGELRIHVHLAATRRGHTIEYCAVFQREQSVRGSQSDSDLLKHSGRDTRQDRDDAGRDVYCTDHHDEPVFIRSVQLMKRPKTVIPSFVRLQFLDDCDNSTPRGLYLFQSSGFKFVGIVANRETKPLGFQRLPISKHQLPDEQIKGGPQIVESIADDRGQSEGRLRLHADAKEIVSRLWLVFLEDEIGLGLKESADLRCEIVDVLFGPFDFCLGAVEGGLHGV